MFFPNRNCKAYIDSFEGLCLGGVSLEIMGHLLCFCAPVLTLKTSTTLVVHPNDSWMVLNTEIATLKTFCFNLVSRLTNKITSRLVHRYRSVLGHLNLRGCCNLTLGSLKIIGRFVVFSLVVHSIKLGSRLNPLAGYISAGWGQLFEARLA